jgi:HD-GYP domain-containing protein (c-di-GMP phosphodiesterase class II)
MLAEIGKQTNMPIRRILLLLSKLDRLRLPVYSRLDIESILVRQASKELDHSLPWQTGHGRRTAVCAVAIGYRVGLSRQALHDLELAALLHDIGLLTLPFSLLSHSGLLDADSYVAVQSHPRVGAELLEPFLCLREASVLIAHHHERWDGSGYPYGLRGAFIPYGSRILAIADAFDAIRVPDKSDPELRARIAIRILRVAAGTQFDPELIDRFCELLGESDPRCPYDNAMFSV